jgi:hypothetical protein
LTIQNGKITGSTGIDSSCYALDQKISLTGTVDSQNNFTITSAAVIDQIVTWTATLSAAGDMISSGTYKFLGGCSDGITGQFTGNKVTTLTGKFIGKLTGGIDPIDVTANLTQQNAKLSGTVSYASVSCTEDFDITTSQAGGTGFQMDLVAKDRHRGFPLRPSGRQLSKLKCS